MSKRRQHRISSCGRKPGLVYVTDVCSTRWSTQGRVALDSSSRVDISQMRSVAVEFCRSAPVVVQLWKADVNQIGAYTLLWDIPVDPPAFVPGRKVVSIYIHLLVCYSYIYRPI